VNEYGSLTNTHWIARSSIPAGTKIAKVSKLIKIVIN